MYQPLKFFLPRFFGYALMMLFITFIIRTDFKLQDFSESSYTEYTQESFLFFVICIFLYCYFKKPAVKVLSLLFSLFFLVHLIRELDSIFDQIVHGFWLYPALVVVLFSFLVLYKNWKKFWEEFNTIHKTYPFGILLCGLIILHVFSRIYGTTSTWKYALQDEYLRIIKDASQESIELLGYSFILIATVEWLVYRFER